MILYLTLYIYIYICSNFIQGKGEGGIVDTILCWYHVVDYMQNVLAMAVFTVHVSWGAAVVGYGGNISMRIAQ